MKQLIYYITTKSPVIINTYGSDRNMTNTLDFIPGRTLLGALAARYIDINQLGKSAHTDDKFRKLFLFDNVRFLNAYPSYEGAQFLPSPMYLQKKKDDFEVSFSFDDNEDFKTFSGYVAQKQGHLYEHSIEQTSFFHNTRGLSDNLRIKGHSEEKGIFNYEAIAPFSTFKGCIVGDEAELQEIKKIIMPNNKLRIGKSKLVQYGEIDIDIIEGSNFTERDNFPHYPSNMLEDNEVVLTLLSDTILYNNSGYSSTSTEDLENHLKEKTGLNLHIKKSIIGKRYVEKYVNIWHLKTPLLTAFSAGSSFLIEFQEIKNVASVKEKLQEVIYNGLGIMNAEGFGEAILTFPDNDTVAPEYIESSTRLKRKIDSVPNNKQVGKELSKQLIKESIKEYVINIAYTEASEFARNASLPSNSLLSKLELLSSSMNSKEFKKIFFEGRKNKTLPADALRQLKKARTDKKTLMDYILKGSDAINLDTINGRLPEVNKLCKELGIELRGDKEFSEELFHLFWPHLFRALRKMKKGGSL